MHRGLFSILIFCLFLSSCEKEVIVPASEPDIPATDVIVPEKFSFSVESITDCDMHLKWYPIKNASNYDIIINDTMVIYDIKKNEYLDYYYYQLTNLEADTEYKLAVRAKSKDLNVTISDLTSKTLKNFIDGIIQISLNKYEYEFSGCHYSINTNDDGVLMVLRVYHYGEEQTLFVKLSNEYQFEWITLANMGHPPTNICIINSPKGGYVFLHDSWITKINESGEIIWTTEIGDNDDNLCALTELPDGNFWVIGNSNGRKSCMIKISLAGKFIFKKYRNGDHIFEKVIAKDDGNLLICGLNAYYNPYNPLSQNVVVWEYDSDGNSLNMNEIDTGYPASYTTGVYLLNDGNFYITGSCTEWYQVTSGSRNSLIKIDPHGNPIWSKKYDHGGGGVSPHIVAGYPNLDGNCLLLISDDRGVGFLQIDSNGNVLQHTACYGYPYGRTIKQIDPNRCMYVSNYAEVIVINLDGYKGGY